MKGIAFRRTHRRARATMALWLSMTIAIAACASPDEPPALGDCNASGDAACTSAPLGGSAGGPSNGGPSGSGGEAGSIASGTGGAGPVSGVNDAGGMPIANTAIVAPPPSD